MITSMGNAAPKCIKADVIYPAFLTGMDLVKKKVELIRNEIKIPNDENFYKIKKHPKVLAEELEKLAQGEKEGNFLLDCTNLITSNKKEYVSLYDYHLVDYFKSDANKKELPKRVFVGEKRFIIYDPVHSKRMRHDLKNKKLNN
jgi:hypothetical protein